MLSARTVTIRLFDRISDAILGGVTLNQAADGWNVYSPYTRVLDLPPGGGHRGYAAVVNGSGLMAACCCSHSMGGR